MNRAANLILLYLIAPLMGVSQEHAIKVRIDNPLALDRTGEIVELRWNELLRLQPSLAATHVAVKDIASGRELAHQVIDEDLDQRPDFLIVRVDVPAKGSLSLALVSNARKETAQASFTDARFVLPREDLAWENDRIAFRIYGPALAKEVNNGIDVWTKRVRYLVVEKWYKANEGNPSGRDSYHEDRGEGADFFSVGRTLGAGSSALVQGDSLFQAGVFESYRIISTGPLRAMFELTYKPVQFDGESISETKRISLDAGVNLNRIEVFFRATGMGTVPFAAGIVRRKGVSAVTDHESRFVSLWGLTTEKEEDGYLGTGIVMTKSAFRSTKDDGTHLLILGTAPLNKAVTYYAGAGWTRSGDFKSAEDWNKYLREFSLKAHFSLSTSLSK